MSWKEETEEIERRRSLALQHGGEEAVARQHARGRMTIRERLAALVDPGTFREEGPIAGHAEPGEAGEPARFTPGNYVLGLASIDGRPVACGGEDFTQRGGSPTAAGLRKSVYAEELALRYRIPLIRFLEGGGGSVTGTGGKANRPARPTGDPVFTPSRFHSIAEVLQTVPVVSAAMGAVAGLPAARLAASHLAIMTRDTSQVLVAGPAVVERALGEKKTKEELGGAQVHAKSGVVDIIAQNEAEVMEIVRRFLGYLPRSVSELPPRHLSQDDPNRREERLLEIVPRERRRVYKMRKIVEAVVDEGSFFEMGAGYGRSQITGFARLDGWPVGLWANDPMFYGGSMTAAGAQKARRFIELCDTFHLPIVALVDEPGFMIGSEAEAAGTIRYGVEAICATVRSRVPWASVLIRKTYGVAAAAHFGPRGEVLAWPSAEAGALPIEGGVAVAFRREIAEADDPEGKRKELEDKLSAGRSPFPRSESFGVHDLIDPRETRPRLCAWAGLARRVIEDQFNDRRR
ncbi:MAG: carboxyl transferase domain-containing protein [Myxococcota bacterium]|nr:carboxyl transferase domain-containing protein [Myxococcota bacterium]